MVMMKEVTRNVILMVEIMWTSKVTIFNSFTFPLKFLEVNVNACYRYKVNSSRSSQSTFLKNQEENANPLSSIVVHFETFASRSKLFCEII